MAIGHPHSRSRSTKVEVPPGRVACVRTSHERTRQIDETFKYFINLAWHRKYKDSMHLAGSRESWRLSPRVNRSQRTTRESASRISIANQQRVSETRRTTTNESNESGERGQFVHFKESFVRTDSFANEPSLQDRVPILVYWGYYVGQRVNTPYWPSNTSTIWSPIQGWTRPALLTGETSNGWLHRTAMIKQHIRMWCDAHTFTGTLILYMILITIYKGQMLIGLQRCVWRQMHKYVKVGVTTISRTKNRVTDQKSVCGGDQIRMFSNPNRSYLHFTPGSEVSESIN